MMASCAGSGIHGNDAELMIEDDDDDDDDDALVICKLSSYRSWTKCT